jgi:cyanophycinase
MRPKQPFPVLSLRLRERPRTLVATAFAVFALLAQPTLAGAGSQYGAGAALGAQEVGPANGSLVVVGGALRDTSVVRRFLDLAGGAHRPIVVIPSAGGADDYDEFWGGLRMFQRLGATNLTVLHTYDRAEADTEEFVEPLKNAAGVWFGGGRQWRLADSYLDTRVHEELWKLLDRGGVIGGSSAGASIQGSFMVRGDSQTNTIMMGDHQVGLGFLRGVGVDQHLLMRNRQFDMLEVIEAHPELLGIGLDENTAIVVQGDDFQVMGQGYVAIYDAGATLDSGGKFYFLAPGDRFDMATRQATRPVTRTEPLGRVTPTPWQGGR